MRSECCEGVEHNFKLEGCIVLNEHNTVFVRNGPLYEQVFPLVGCLA